MSVHKKGDGYIARIYKRPSKTFKTKKEALAYQAKVLNLKSNNPSAEISTKTLFPEVARKFLEEVERTKSYNTYRSYESKYRIWINPTLEHHWIGAINHRLIVDFQEKLKEKEIGDTTYDLVNVVLYEILNYATEPLHRYILENPMPKNERKQATRRPLASVKYWTKGQTEAFLAAAKESPYLDTFTFFLNTGIRFNELAVLQSTSFDVNSGSVNIFEQICERNKDGSSFFIKPTKGNEHRSIPLNGPGKHVASKLVHESEDLFLFCPGNTEEKKVLIKKGSKSVVESHKVLTNRTLAYAMKRICESAKVPYIGPHGLRHTFSANFLMNGGNIFILSKFLGHKSINTTINNYGHLSQEFMASAANIVSFGESK